MANMIDILAENEKLRAQVQELLPWAREAATVVLSAWRKPSITLEDITSAAQLLGRIENSEFGEPQ